MDWNRGSNHRGPLIWKFLEVNRRLNVEEFPEHVPELKPAEILWNRLKYGPPANHLRKGVGELENAVIDRLVELKCRPGMCRQQWARWIGQPWSCDSNSHC